MKYCPRCKENITEQDYRPSQYKRKSGWCRSCCSVYENINKDKKSFYNKVYGKTNKNKIKANRILKREQYNQAQRNRRVSKREIYNLRYLPTILAYKKARRKVDSAFKLRETVSAMINYNLKKQNSTKNNSIIVFLNYSMKELKEHLEKQFESWMTWNNWGKYNKATWDDNNPTTWIWNIDHIVPQSKLPYSNMIDDNFKKCWALENLRPLSAKQNVIDNNKRDVI